MPWISRATASCPTIVIWRPTAPMSICSEAFTRSTPACSVIGPVAFLELNAPRHGENEAAHHAVRWFLGRCWRADDLCRDAGRVERDLRGNRPAHPVISVEE